MKLISLDNRLPKVSYTILPARPDGYTASIELQNKLYLYWKEIWRKVFEKTGTADDLSPDEFFRQDIMTCIQYDDEIIGMHFYTFFNMYRLASIEHSYMAAIDPEIMMKIKEMNQIMAMEYLTVNAKWRKQELGIPWGEIVIALGMKLLPFTPCDAAIGTARTDLNVGKMGEIIGFTTFDKRVVKYGYECSVHVCDRKSIKSHPDPVINNYIEIIWQNRRDYTELTLPKTQILKIVA